MTRRAVQAPARGPLTLLAVLGGLLLTACGARADTGSVAHRLTTVAARHVAVPAARVSAGPAGTRRVTIRSGGHTRTFLVDAPAGGTGRHPLVLVFHGTPDTARHTIAETDFEDVASQHHWIVVFPQGYGQSWDDGVGGTPAEHAAINDVRFTQQILRFMEARYRVDRRHVVAAGFSNGALLTQLLGCRLAGELSLAVPIEGQMWRALSPACRPSRPISVFEIHGTADTVLPYRGGTFQDIPDLLPAPASAARWATLDRCATDSPTTRTIAAATSPQDEGPSLITDEGASQITTYHGCAARTSVTLDTIDGGIHEWTPNIANIVLTAMRAHPSAPVATP